MITSKYFLLAILLTIAAGVATFVAYPYLPAIVPTHWDIHNHVNGYTPKVYIFLVGPGLMTLIMLLMYFLPWLSPRQFEVDTFRSTYLYIMLLIVTLMAYAYGIILWVGTGHPVNVGRAIIGGVSLLFALMGNVMGKIRRNFYVGVRTPWALANERVWNATHRFAAKIFVIAGLTGLLFSALSSNVLPGLIPIIVAGIIPVIYSLVIYKQMEKRGELSEAAPPEGAK